MSLSVTKMAPELVSPCDPTPTDNLLPLSSMDKTAPVGFMLDLALVYGHGHEPAKVIRGALSRALVPYHPVAGRIVASDKGEVEVASTATGVWFVEASADCTLEDVNRLERPLSVPAAELLPQAPTKADSEGLILLVQVTEFKCGGFAVGIRFNHAIFDGVGAGQFFQAVGEMARGLPQPTTKPVWCREAIPSPPKASRDDHDPPFFTPPRFVETVYDVSLDSINLIKNEYVKETGRKCSTFDAVAAALWQSRTRAIGIEFHADVCVGLVADVRNLMGDVLPAEGGYYGNCVYPTGVTASSDMIVHASLVEVVDLIKEAKKLLSAKMADWFRGDPREEPSKPRMDYGALCLTDWSRVGFAEVDYGWGDPIHVVPLIGEGHPIASAIFLKPPVPQRGLRVMASCVIEEHQSAFNDEMMKLA
ncbi:hypothetical protein OPV22_031143 [Ensete ventricosum]|uniref:3'-N-debenzoyl-2'-deoxytaxol N-benzoyltransferase n=1 Tax=Ensete ventricosum TaxID=4639 RepID=A0AAV8PSN9_ENSVE|nr:hypothetical protein OPV22_031143 [Ensete ventricosum]